MISTKARAKQAARMRRCVLELRGCILRDASLPAVLLRMRSEQALMKKDIYFQLFIGLCVPLDGRSIAPPKRPCNE